MKQEGRGSSDLYGPPSHVVASNQVLLSGEYKTKQKAKAPEQLTACAVGVWGERQGVLEQLVPASARLTVEFSGTLQPRTSPWKLEIGMVISPLETGKHPGKIKANANRSAMMEGRGRSKE